MLLLVILIQLIHDFILVDSIDVCAALEDQVSLDFLRFLFLQLFLASLHHCLLSQQLSVGPFIHLN